MRSDLLSGVLLEMAMQRLAELERYILSILICRVKLTGVTFTNGKQAARHLFCRQVFLTDLIHDGQQPIPEALCHLLVTDHGTRWQKIIAVSGSPQHSAADGWSGFLMKLINREQLPRLNLAECS